MIDDRRAPRDHDRRREKDERRIRFAKAKGRKTFAEIAEAVGVSSIHSYSRGGCPAADVGIHVAHYLQIELDWWIIGEEASSTAIPTGTDHDQSLLSTVANSLDDVKVRLGQIRDQVAILEKQASALETSIGLFQKDARQTLDDLTSKLDDLNVELIARREELGFLERQEAGFEAAIRHIKLG